MAVKEMVICDICKKPIYGHNNGIRIHGNLYGIGSDGRSSYGLIGNNFPTESDGIRVVNNFIQNASKYTNWGEMEESVKRMIKTVDCCISCLEDILEDALEDEEPKKKKKSPKVRKVYHTSCDDDDDDDL